MLSFQLVAGDIFDNYGPRLPLAVGSILHILGLLGASFSTEYYQIFLSRAVCSPIGSSLIMSSAVLPASHIIISAQINNLGTNSQLVSHVVQSKKVSSYWHRLYWLLCRGNCDAYRS